MLWSHIVSRAPVFLLPLPTFFLLLCFKGIFKLHFLADSEWNVIENWVAGLCFCREAQPETKKSSFSSSRVSFSREGHFQWETISIKTPPCIHSPLPHLNLNETTDCNYRSLCALYMRPGLLSHVKIHGHTHAHTQTLWRLREAQSAARKSRLPLKAAKPGHW